MPVFGRSVPVVIVRAAGAADEKRWSTVMGGDLATKALFYAADRVITGDEIHCEYFDEPRVITIAVPFRDVDGRAGNRVLHRSLLWMPSLFSTRGMKFLEETR